MHKYVTYSNKEAAKTDSVFKRWCLINNPGILIKHIEYATNSCKKLKKEKNMNTRSNGNPYSEKALAMLKKLYPTTDTQKLANRLGRTKEAVRKKANRLGLVKQ